MGRQQFVKETTLGSTERLDHTLNWSDIVDPLDDPIVDCDAAVDGKVLIDGVQFTESDSTVWLLGNGVTSGKCFAHHDVTLKSGRKLRRTARVNCVKR